MTTASVCDVIRRRISTLCALLVLAASSTTDLAAQTNAQILHDLRSFRVVGTVLHVGAHPDDENTQLIAYLAHGRAYRTAYLSVTRGDGGQNLLSADLGEKLGVARTQELLAARRIDGGRQFFTRAIDYGFSKDYNEALGVWGHQQVLSDVVRVIRTFRPDVIITRFSTQAGGTHGHHTASAVLALEAFKAAADPNAFPEQLGAGGLDTWQAKRILVNGGTQGVGGANAEASAAIRMDVGGTDPVLNESFASVAARSRGMHKTQGFGQTPSGGPVGAPGGPGAAGVPGAPRMESFQLLAGEPATTDVMQGVDTTWARIPGGAKIGMLANDIIANYDSTNPAASLDALMHLRAQVKLLPKSWLLTEKQALLDHIIIESLGITISTTIPTAEHLPRESVPVRSTITMKANGPVTWATLSYPNARAIPVGSALKPGVPVTRVGSIEIPANAELTQPYWLRSEPGRGLYQVTQDNLIGLPENPEQFPVTYVLTIGNQTMQVADAPVTRETGRHISIIQPVAIKFTPATSVFAPLTPHRVSVLVTAMQAQKNGEVLLQVPAGWTVEPASQPFKLFMMYDSARLEFTVTPPVKPATVSIGARAALRSANATQTAVVTTQRVVIDYQHIPLQLLQPPARLRASSFVVATRGTRIGYVEGAGDDVPDALRQMGYSVTMLDSAAFTSATLQQYDAIVLGIRVANVRTDMATLMAALNAYVEAGGTVISQYNQTSGLKTSTLAPYSLTLSGDRVTDENASVRFLAPDHAVLNTPNRITADDFKGWVQELGTYFPNRWDPHFTPIIAASDAGEAPLNGGLLVAEYGKGHFVYTGLAFFRQLPAGVPGAYRLFANLVSLGKAPVQ